MHALEVIVRRNDEAAGRAEAEAVNRGDIAQADKILKASTEEGPLSLAYALAYLRERGL